MTSSQNKRQERVVRKLKLFEKEINRNVYVQLKKISRQVSTWVIVIKTCKFQEPWTDLYAAYRNFQFDTISCSFYKQWEFLNI